MLPLFARLYLWATRRLYNELAWAYDAVAWLVSGGRWDRWRRLALDYVAGEPILEIGFGTGELLIALARRGQRVVGLDLSPAMHRVTAAKLRRAGLGGLSPLRVRGLAQRLPFPDAAFATVLSTFPAEYILDPATLREVWRVLRPGGRLVVVGLVVWVERSAWGEVARLALGSPRPSPVDRWRRRAEEAGFAVTEVVREDPPARVPVLIAEVPRCPPCT